MQKFMMFSDIPSGAQFMYPDGTIKDRAGVVKDYPILGTAYGVIGFQTDAKGTVGDLIMMGYYDNINSFLDAYVPQGVEITDSMTNAQKCAAVTEFVANPPNSEEDALDTYLSM